VLLDLVFFGGTFVIAYAIARRRGQQTKKAIIIGLCAGVVAWVLYAALFLYMMSEAWNMHGGQ
jgi:hypothetical protein